MGKSKVKDHVADVSKKVVLANYKPLPRFGRCKNC